MVDASMDIDALIARRASENGAERERAELWLASVAAYNRRRQEEHRAAWRDYHERMAESIERTAAALAKEHRRRAEQLMTDGHEERSP